VFKAIVFDLDGTLYEYFTPAEESMEHVYELVSQKHNIKLEMLVEAYKIILEEAIKKGFHQEKPDFDYRKERFRLLLEKFSLSDDELLDRMLDRYESELDIRMKPFPDVERTLENLKNRYRLHIATAGPPESQRKKLKVLGLEAYFEKIFISGELNKKKATGELFKHILGVLNCKPDEILVIGDSYEMDILGSGKAGIQSVWINKTNQKKEGDVHLAEIENIEELLKIL